MISPERLLSHFETFSRALSLVWKTCKQSVPAPLPSVASRDDVLQRSHTVSSDVWKKLSTRLDLNDANAVFWWNMTGAMLSVLLMEAGYDEASQENALAFYLTHIVPHLGPRPKPDGSPSGWHSFMTDDFSPIEYSWTWSSVPRIRYAVEAIGSSPDFSDDMFNQQSTLELIDKLKFTNSKTNWRVFDILYECLAAIEPHAQLTVSNDSLPTGKSSLMLAFEPWKSEFACKAYLTPVKALSTGESPLHVASRSFKRLRQMSINVASYETFLQYFTSHDEDSHLTFLAIAIDCIESAESRFKIYVRSSKTSFESVCHDLCCGVVPSASWTPDILDQLKELWYAVLGLEKHFPVSEELPTNDHHTAGILYNYDVGATSKAPDTKVYIPVKHYAKDDDAIAKALVAFLKRRGGGESCNQYLSMLQKVCTYRCLESRRGLQTYIQCGVKNKQLQLTSYLSPEVYSQSQA